MNEKMIKEAQRILAHGMDMDKPMAQALLDAEKENQRISGLLRKATKALMYCTIMSFPKEKHELPNFSDGVLYAIESVSKYIWGYLGSPEGKPNYMWWEKQIDPDVVFTDKDGKVIPYETP